MNFAALKAELAARGFADASDARAGQFINDAIAEIDGMFKWPYRQAEATGATPLTITDLVSVDTVVSAESTSVLEPVPFETLVDWYGGDLSTTGDPQFFYVAWPGGIPEVATYPVGTDDIVVAYYKVSPVLSAASDTPLAPSRFHYVYLAVACRMAGNDVGEDSARWQGEADRGLQLMVDALLTDQEAGSQQRLSFASEDW